MTESFQQWLPAEESAGLEDFFRVYDAHYEALTDATMAAAREDPHFGPIVKAMSPEQIEEQNRDGRVRLRRAMQGHWAQYEANLREQGTLYATLGVEYRAWYRLVRAVGRDLIPLLVAEYSSDRERLAKSLSAMHGFFDWAMATIGDAYLDASQAQLAEREQHLSTTLDSIGDGVIATDDSGAIARMNPVAEQLTGWSADEARGRPLSEVFRIINEETRETVESPADRVLREGVIVGLANHTVLLARDGTERPIADSGAPIRGADGVMRGVVLVFRDMTEQRDAEHALRRSEARFQRLSHSGIIGILTIGTAGKISDANGIFLETFGYTRDELMSGSLSWREMTPEEWLPRDEAALAEIATTGACTPFEKELFHKDGSRIPALMGAARLDDREAIAFILDIRGQKELEAYKVRSAELEVENRKAQEANRLKSEFLANMSHELRTPMNAIIGFAELIHDGEVTPEMPEHAEFIGDILTSGRHLLRLINDVLDLSKVEAGKLQLHPEDVKIGELVREVIGIVRATAAEKQIRVETEISDKIGPIVADGSRIKQVLYNYVSNALKFTPPGGSVLVHVKPEGTGAFRIEVEDTGPGIADDDMDRLFVEFEQLDAVSTKHHGGTGLGLALTRRLVEAQGGTVGVRSEVGNGSTFFAVLPCRATSGKPVPLPRNYPGARPDSASILVIEDDERDQRLIVKALTEAGYAVETAATGAQAVAKCQARHFDAITLDLLLPDIGGVDVLRAIRETNTNRDVPVVVITVVTEKGAVAGLTVHDMLPKPVDQQVLMESLLRAGVSAKKDGQVLIVDDDASSLKLMTMTLSQLGYECLCTDQAIRGLEIAASDPPLAVVLDLIMPEMDGFEFLERFRELPGCRATPVIVWTVKDLTTEEHTRLMTSARGVLQKGRESGRTPLDDLAEFLPAKPRQARHETEAG